MTDIRSEIAYLEGIPRKNGELVFSAPWQGRVFGMAIALTAERFQWETFRSLLIAEIAAAPDREYYASWVAALERLVVEPNVVSDSDLATRRAEFVAMQRDEIY
ncbi:MAG: nitrile hydratase accessory protein [Chloroflexi bacterium]|nr:MAG: nitrile hydratase accessory protein [Chloroflexota bacterium]